MPADHLTGDPVSDADHQPQPDALAEQCLHAPTKLNNRCAKCAWPSGSVTYPGADAATPGDRESRFALMAGLQA